MHIPDELEGSIRILALEDRVDNYTVPDLEKKVMDLIADGGRDFLMDCEKLEYVNSAGLKVFLLAAKKLEPVNGRIAFCAMKPSVFMVFELTGFDKLFSIVADRATALGLLQSKV